LGWEVQLVGVGGYSVVSLLPQFVILDPSVEMAAIVAMGCVAIHLQ
jgi:hypothetical protein